MARRGVAWRCMALQRPGSPLRRQAAPAQGIESRPATAMPRHGSNAGVLLRNCPHAHPDAPAYGAFVPSARPPVQPGAAHETPVRFLHREPHRSAPRPVDAGIHPGLADIPPRFSPRFGSRYPPFWRRPNGCRRSGEAQHSAPQVEPLADTAHAGGQG